MIIDGKDYKIIIQILCMKHEVAVTLLTVETLLESLEDGVIISVLMNGGSSSQLRDLFSRFGALRYYESEENLGVAGGRNFLLRTEECRSSDIVMFLDNDVIPPQDYVRNMTEFLLDNEDSGVVGPAIAEVKRAADGNGNLLQYLSAGIWGGHIIKLSSADIKANILSDPDSKRLNHLGMHENYRFAYFSVLPEFCMIESRLLRIFGVNMNRHPTLKLNTKYMDMIKKGVDKYRVSNVLGGGQVFRRTLVDEIGGLDERFNVYSLEDAHFAIRSLQAGYKNYINTNTWLYHGTDMRHTTRDPIKMCLNEWEKRTILASTIYPSPLLVGFVTIKMAVGLALIMAIRINLNMIVYLAKLLFKYLAHVIKVNRDVFRASSARIRGAWRGLRIIRRCDAEM